MKIVYRITAVLIIYLSFACQPSSLIKKEEVKAAPDSVLFYQQKDIADPFIDAVIAAKEDTLILHTLLIPPPPPPEKYRQIEGLRVQVFAGLDSLNAKNIRHQLANAQSDSVYLFKEKGLFKIQVGDYPYRMEADRKKQELKTAGFKGAWVVQTLINVPLDSMNIESDNKSIREEKRPRNEGFKIQVLATGDKMRAEEVVQTLKQQFNYAAFSQKVKDLYKVYLGYFSDRQEAEKVLQDVRINGYPDAWIVK